MSHYSIEFWLVNLTSAQHKKVKKLYRILTRDAGMGHDEVMDKLHRLFTESERLRIARLA